MVVQVTTPHGRCPVPVQPEALAITKTTDPLVQDFMAMLHERRGEQLDDWIEQAKESGIEDLQRFATGLDADHGAVQAELILEWSQGQVEGRVNRLKLL